MRKATALAVSADILWIGTQDGLFAWNGDEIVHVDGTGGWCVTALGIGPGLGFGEQVLWAGTAARGDELLVFEVAAPDLVVAHDGRDLGSPPRIATGASVSRLTGIPPRDLRAAPTPRTGLAPAHCTAATRRWIRSSCG